MPHLPAWVIEVCADGADGADGAGGGGGALGGDPARGLLDSALGGSRVVALGEWAGAESVAAEVVAESARALGADALADRARRAGADPATSGFLTDAPESVELAREAGFACVLGIAPARGGARLRAAGADGVVADLPAAAACSCLRRRRRPAAAVPAVPGGEGGLIDAFGTGPWAIFLDYDGTLAPIVDDPAAAAIAADTRDVIARLSERAFVAVVTGRDREDIEARVALPGIFYAGSHGLDISGPGGRRLEHPGGAAALPALAAAEAELSQRFMAFPGVRLERKRFSLAVHYRQVAAGDVEKVCAAVRDVAPAALRLGEGKKVIELVPDVDWHKGRAVVWLLEACGLDRADTTPVFFGDDVTDEDGFAVLGGDGVAVLAGEPGERSTYADLRVADDDEVREVLAHLAANARGSTPRLPVA